MEKIRNFAIFKNNEKKNDKQPDYTISVKVGEKYVTAGGAWLKEGKTGKFFSCKLSESYQDRPGFYIEVDGVKTEEKPEQIIDMNSVPF